MDINRVNRIAFTQKSVREAVAYMKRNKNRDPAPYLVAKFGKALKHKQSKLFVHGYEVVPQESRDTVLKKMVYSASSTAPFGRDSLFHKIKTDKLVGLSRRYISGYLSRQPIITTRQSKPKRIVRKNVASLRDPSAWATDLVHIRIKDLPDDYLGEPDDGQSENADRYFLSVVNLLTGYLYIAFIRRKLASHVVIPMRTIVNKINRQFPKGIKSMSSDKGSEFFGETGAMFREKGITHRTMALSPHIESRNSYLQNTFYRLVAMKRGGLKSVTKQTQNIVNNTIHNQTGISPVEALKLLKAGQKVPRKDYKPTVLQPNKPAKKMFTIGQRVKKLTQPREKGVKLDYKRYRGTHIGKTVYTIVKRKKIKSYGKYLLSNDEWVWHDQLVPASVEDNVKLPLTPLNKIKKRKIPAPKATRRSGRLRGARVDYTKFY